MSDGKSLNHQANEFVPNPQAREFVPSSECVSPIVEYSSNEYFQDTWHWEGPTDLAELASCIQEDEARLATVRTRLVEVEGRVQRVQVSAARTDSELESLKQRMETLQSARKADEDVESMQQRKEIDRSLRQLRKQKKLVETELSSVTEAISAQERETRAPTGRGERWLVIGSKWDSNLGRWGSKCGHMSTPGDAWSAQLGSSRDELKLVSAQLIKEEEVVLERLRDCNPQLKLQTLSRDRKLLKAQARLLQQEKIEGTREKKEMRKWERQLTKQIAAAEKQLKKLQHIQPSSRCGVMYSGVQPYVNDMSRYMYHESQWDPEHREENCGAVTEPCPGNGGIDDIPCKCTSLDTDDVHSPVDVEATPSILGEQLAETW